MGKVLALDVGDVWTGMALSDPLGMIARPYTTVKTVDLEEVLSDLLVEQSIDTVIVGHPRTMKGAISEQTKKAKLVKEQLERKFETVPWILWDERLTSKRAQTLKKGSKKQEKLKSHAIAAAYILDSYLEYLRVHA